MDKFIKTTKSVIINIVINVLALFFGFNGFNLVFLPLVVLGGFIYFHHLRLMGSLWTIRVESKKYFTTKGFFGYLRHPLYLGVLIACFASSFLFNNWLMLIVTLFIDVPFIYKRALIEENLLSRTLKGYKAYVNRTGMFTPRFKLIFQ